MRNFPARVLRCRVNNTGKVWRGLRGTVLGSAALIGIAGAPAASQSLGVYGQDFSDAVFTPETVLMPAPTAAFSTYVTKPAGFGSGAEALGLHYAVSLSDNVSGKFLRKFAFAACRISANSMSPWEVAAASAAGGPCGAAQHLRHHGERTRGIQLVGAACVGSWSGSLHWMAAGGTAQPFGDDGAPGHQCGQLSGRGHMAGVHGKAAPDRVSQCVQVALSAVHRLPELFSSIARILCIPARACCG